MKGYKEFAERWGEGAQLAWDTIQMKPTRGIPIWGLNVMDVALVEEMTGHSPGDFARDPDRVYIAFQKLAGACFIDQYIPENPLSMGQNGFDSTTRRKATTGAERIVVDGIEIDSPEDVVEHMERFVFPGRVPEMESFGLNARDRIEQMIESECAVQRLFGTDLLKGPYNSNRGFQSFPRFHYGRYGYANYFMAYVLYPEVMEKDFAQQADLAALANAAATRAITEGALPPLVRLDHDMADSRGTLVDIKTLDRLWLPHFARSIKPFLDAGIRLIWHCDGNLMEMVPRLLEAGISGFQGFQYEFGMDYEHICRMTDGRGEPLLIIAGVSVTRTLPFGTKEDVRREIRWLVENGPKQGLFLGASSSITPRTKRENIKTLIEGLKYYREHGRSEC